VIIGSTTSPLGPAPAAHPEDLHRQPVHPLDVSDDRLATVLEALSDDTHWTPFEGALNQHTLRVYDLEPACVRMDSTPPTAMDRHGRWAVPVWPEAKTIAPTCRRSRS